MAQDWLEQEMIQRTREIARRAQHRSRLTGKGLGSSPPSGPPRVALVAAALVSVYILWGSTYLSIRVAIETMPPMLMAATRYLLAGGLLFIFTVGRGEAVADRPRPRQWLAALVAGGLMLAGGNGGVTWAEQHLPSGLAALLVALVPPLAHPDRALHEVGTPHPGGDCGHRDGTCRGGHPGRPLHAGSWRPAGRAGHRRGLDGVGGRLALRAAGAAAAPAPGWDIHGDAGGVGGALRGRRLRRRVRAGPPRAPERPVVSRARLPRGVRLADRVHRLRLAAPQRQDLIGRHVRVREPRHRGLHGLAGAGRGGDGAHPHRGGGHPGRGGPDRHRPLAAPAVA